MFNKNNVKEFRADFQKAVAELEKKYGANISLGTIRFSEEELRAKMTAIIGKKTPTITKNNFSVGDKVRIYHRKMDPNKVFTIVKINKVNIRVMDEGGNEFRVHPSLLVKK